MKHIFVINPIAGKSDKTNYIKEVLFKRNDIDYVVYNTKSVGDATRYVKEFCEKEPNEDLRFYSCGGDGTLNEVVSGLVGYPNASFTCYPCGSGNDYVKATPGHDFTDINQLIDGTNKLVDLVKVNEHYSTNIVNIGFDAAVSYNMNKFKRWPLVSGKVAYNLALFYTLLREMHHIAKIYVDDELVFDGDFLLTAACNGVCCGGGFYFAPKALIDDGIMNQLIVKSVSRIRFILMVKNFKNGKYEEYPKIMRYINLHNCKKIKVVSEKELIYGFDGEAGMSKEINIEVLPSFVNFCVPQLSKNLDK